MCPFHSCSSSRHGYINFGNTFVCVSVCASVCVCVCLCVWHNCVIVSFLLLLVIDHRHHRINFGRAFACACARVHVYVYVCVIEFAGAIVFLFLTIAPYCRSAISFLVDTICARTCVSACMRAKGFCYRSSPGLVDFSPGCVFCVRMCVCLFVWFRNVPHLLWYHQWL